jgi:hypothetical protein
MGGVGSGSWYRSDKKPTTSKCHSVDVRHLHREGLLKSGRSFTLRWSRAGRESGSIRGILNSSRQPESMTLLYRYRSGPGGEWKNVREPVPLNWTACNFGGERPWFACPGVGCSRRVAILYGLGRYFLCRHCYGLSYQSQRDNKMYRALHRAQNLRRQLGGSANMMESFPERLKGMHHETYWRLREQHDEAEMAQLAGMKAWIDKLEKTLG